MHAIHRAVLEQQKRFQRHAEESGRIEPRALKRRANAYPLLTKPRKEARAEVREHGHRKKTLNQIGSQLTSRRLRLT